MNPNQGSFGAAIGGADPIQEAIARRQSGQAGGTAQVSPSAPSFDPATQAPQTPQNAQQGMPPQQPMPQQPQPEAQPTMHFDSAEAKMIIQALTKRLDSSSKFLMAPMQALTGGA